MKEYEIYRIKGTTERVEIVSVRGNNVIIRRANGTCNAINKAKLRLPIEEGAMRFFQGSGGGWMMLGVIILGLTIIISWIWKS
jgi:hypothetical protein